MRTWKAEDCIESVLLIPEPEFGSPRKKEGKTKPSRQMLAFQFTLGDGKASFGLRSMPDSWGNRVPSTCWAGGEPT